MAVTSCVLSRDPRTARFFVDGNSGISGEVGAVWNVKTDSVDDGPVAVVTGARSSSLEDPLPEFYDTYSLDGDTDANLYFLDVVPTQNESLKTEWRLAGTYRNLPLGTTVGDAQANPLKRPWKYRIDQEVISEPITEAYNLDEMAAAGPYPVRPAGTLGPIENTARQAFEESATEPVTRDVFVAWRNFASLHDIHGIALNYSDSLNISEFRGYPRYYCKFEGIASSDRIVESGYEFYRGTLRITLGRKPFIHKALNVGWKHWDATGKLVNMKDDEKNDITEPQFLNATGGQFKTDDLFTDPLTGRQDYVRYLTRNNLREYNAIFGKSFGSAIPDLTAA